MMSENENVGIFCVLLQVEKGGLEGKVRERDSEIQSLRLMLKEVQATPTKAATIEIGVQATPPSQERAQVNAGVQVTPPSQQGIDAGIQTVYIREMEPHATGEELQFEKIDRENGERDNLKEPVPPQVAKVTAHQDLGGVMRVATTSPRTSMGIKQSPSTAPQNSSLESEMRVAGVEVTDPYDSSEGVGFSDSCNLDEVPDSMHSLDSFKSDRIKEESTPVITSLSREHRDAQTADSAVPVASSIVHQQPSSTVAKQQSTGGVVEANLHLQEEESSSDEHMTSSSDGDLRPRNDQGMCTPDLKIEIIQI